MQKSKTQKVYRPQGKTTMRRCLRPYGESTHSGIVIICRLVDNYIDVAPLCAAYQRNYQDYLRTEHGSKLCDAIRKKGRPNRRLVYSQTVKAAKGSSTVFMHPTLAVSLAFWCSPKCGRALCKSFALPVPKEFARRPQRGGKATRTTKLRKVPVNDTTATVELVQRAAALITRVEELINKQAAVVPTVIVPKTTHNGALLPLKLPDPTTVSDVNLDDWLLDAHRWLVQRWSLDHERMWITIYETYGRQYSFNWRANREALRKRYLPPSSQSEITVKNVFQYTNRLRDLCNMVYAIWGDGNVYPVWDGRYSKHTSRIDLLPINNMPPGLTLVARSDVLDATITDTPVTAGEPIVGVDVASGTDTSVVTVRDVVADTIIQTTALNIPDAPPKKTPGHGDAAWMQRRRLNMGDNQG